MRQGKLISRLLVSAIVSGLFVSYRQVEVTARVSLPNPIIEIVQAKPGSPNLKTVQEDAKKLKESLDTLNSDLAKVVKKDIDRSKVDFNTPKDQLTTLKTNWEQYKQELSKNPQNLTQAQNLIGQVDNEIKSLEEYLSPLNPEIIQSLDKYKEYSKKKNEPDYSKKNIKIQKLEEYQKKLFGKESNSSNSDGVFGSGTQGKIKEVSSQLIDNLIGHLGEIEKSISPEGEAKDSPASPSPSPESGNLEEQVKNLRQEIDNLKTQVNQQAETIKQLQNKLAGKAITGETVTDGESPLNPRALLVVIFILGVGLISWKIWKLWGNYKKQALKKNNPSPQPKSEDNQVITNNPAQPASTPKSQGNSHSRTSSGQVSRQTPISLLGASNLSVTSNQTTNPSVQAQASHQVLPKLESIQSEEDLVAFYNGNARALESQIIVVTTTEDSFEEQRAGHSAPIIFQKSVTGNYWITLVPDLEPPYYYLVPKASLVVNRTNYATFQEIFDCQGYETKTSKNFQLKLPAVVTYEPEGYWKLHDLGELEFN